MEVLLAAYSARGEENARKAREDLFGVQNSRKAYDGRVAGLMDPELMRQKQEAETRASAKSWPRRTSGNRPLPLGTAASPPPRPPFAYGAPPNTTFTREPPVSRASCSPLPARFSERPEERPKPNGDRLRASSWNSRPRVP